ncbi:hypothetical protein ACF0H5_001019 [Mactra antiquata]
MWPYTGRRVNRSTLGQLDISTGNTYAGLTKPGMGEPDREYYNRLSMSVSVGLRSFPANRIASDGRIVRQYGISEHDVTDQYLTQDQCATRVRYAPPQNQFHHRNVSQLKVVLNMPERQRRESLSHLTGAIVRNEVVPSKGQLNNDEFLHEHLTRSTSNLQSKVTKLPPLTRPSSMEQVKRLEKMALSGQLNESVKYKMAYEPDDTITDEEGLPIMKRRSSRTDIGVNFNQRKLGESRLLHSSNCRRRKGGILYGLTKSKTTSDGFRDSDGDRKDSVGLVTESIREQFKTALQNQRMSASPDTDSRTPGSVLGLLGRDGNENIVKQVPTESKKNVVNGYKVRHEYGKNLERNWFRNQFMKKQARDIDNNSTNRGYNLRLSLFYSPEPQSDDEIEDSDIDAESADDEASMRCGGFSTTTAKEKSRGQRMGLNSLEQSLDLHEDVDEQTDGDSSNTDIEIVLKDNKLIQRKTKHKLKKKRQRQMERYRAFLPHEIDNVREKQEINEPVPLTDQQIRAMRLNLRNKEKTRLKGKRKFRQVGKAVCAFVHFRNILNKVRRKKRQMIKRRQQKIAQMVAKKLAKKVNHNYEESERTPTPKPTLKDQFMAEYGAKLIFEVERLRIPSMTNDKNNDNDYTSSDDSNSDYNEQIEQNENGQSIPLVTKKKSKYELELKKVSLEDVKNVFLKTKKRKSRRLIKKRHSIPKAGYRPLEFTVEIPVKQKTRRSRSAQRKQKEIKRPVSPPVPKCTCYRAKVAASSPPKCPHVPEVKKPPKMKTVKIQTGGLMRTHSLPNLAKMKPIELRDLLADIDIPAKEIKLEILARKFRRQRRKRNQIRLSPCRIPPRDVIPPEDSDNDESESIESSDSDESDYDFVYGGPFVGSGVMWNQTSKDSRKPTWTEADVDREVKRITRLFHEMKECTYLRLDGFNDAIIDRLKKSPFRM